MPGPAYPKDGNAVKALTVVAGAGASVPYLGGAMTVCASKYLQVSRWRNAKSPSPVVIGRTNNNWSKLKTLSHTFMLGILLIMSSFKRTLMNYPFLSATGTSTTPSLTTHAVPAQLTHVCIQTTDATFDNLFNNPRVCDRFKTSLMNWNPCHGRFDARSGGEQCTYAASNAIIRPPLLSYIPPRPA